MRSGEFSSFSENAFCVPRSKDRGLHSSIGNLTRQSAIATISNRQSHSSICNRDNQQSAISIQQFQRLLFKNRHRISPSIHLNGVTPVL